MHPTVELSHSWTMSLGGVSLSRADAPIRLESCRRLAKCSEVADRSPDGSVVSKQEEQEEQDKEEQD